jgi:predicted nuclease with TOPRIM domain
VAELVAQLHRERDAAEQATRDCDRLGRDMGVVMNERDDLRVQTTHLREKLSELKPALDQMAEDLRAVQQSRHEAEDRAQRLQSELGLAVERHIAVTNELSSVRSKYTALVARLESVVKP